MTRPDTSARSVAGWLAGGIAFLLIGQAAMGAVQRYPKSKSAASASSILEALGRLEAQQEEVLRRLEAATKELGIIKVRAATIPTGISTTGGSCN